MEDGEDGKNRDESDAKRKTVHRCRPHMWLFMKLAGSDPPHVLCRDQSVTFKPTVSSTTQSTLSILLQVYEKFLSVAYREQKYIKKGWMEATDSNFTLCCGWRRPARYTVQGHFIDLVIS